MTPKNTTIELTRTPFLVHSVSNFLNMLGLTRKLIQPKMEFFWLFKLLLNLSTNCCGVKSPSELCGRNSL